MTLRFAALVILVALNNPCVCSAWFFFKSSQKDSNRSSTFNFQQPPPNLDAIPTQTTSTFIEGSGTFSLRGFASSPPVYFVAEPNVTQPGCLSIVNYAGVYVYMYCGFPGDPYTIQNGANMTWGGVSVSNSGPGYWFIGSDGQLVPRSNSFDYVYLNSKFSDPQNTNCQLEPCFVQFPWSVRYKNPLVSAVGSVTYSVRASLSNAAISSTPAAFAFIESSAILYLDTTIALTFHPDRRMLSFVLFWNRGSQLTFDNSILPQNYAHPVLFTNISTATPNNGSLVMFSAEITDMTFNFFGYGQVFQVNASIPTVIYGVTYE